MVNSNAHTPKLKAGTSVAPVNAHVTIRDNIENIRLASNEISQSNFSLNNKYIPIIKKMKRIPETTNSDVSLIKPNLNGTDVKSDKTGGTLN